MHRLDQPRLARLVAEHAADLAHDGRQYGVPDRRVGPDALEQLLLGHQLPARSASRRSTAKAFGVRRKVCGAAPHPLVGGVEPQRLARFGLLRAARSVSSTPASRPACRESIRSVAWGDYDNDGRLDFLLTGLRRRLSVDLPTVAEHGQRIHQRDGHRRARPAGS